jgi:hypothetical protein
MELTCRPTPPPPQARAALVDVATVCSRPRAAAKHIARDARSRCSTSATLPSATPRRAGGSAPDEAARRPAPRAAG